jgi:hypothetical protein
MRAERGHPWSAPILARGRGPQARLQAFDIETIAALADTTGVWQAATQAARPQPRVVLRRKALKSF